MRRELKQMVTIHNLYAAYHRQSFLTDTMLLTLIVISSFFCGVVAITNLNDGRIWVVVIELLLIGSNIFNGFITVKRMIKNHKDFKEENRLYEEARAEMLKFCEIEEAFGEQIELDFGEDTE